jgi:hypothetical protein
MNTLLENNPNQMRVKLPNSSSGEEMITRLSISCSTPWNPKPNNSLCSMTFLETMGSSEYLFQPKRELLSHLPVEEGDPNAQTEPKTYDSIHRRLETQMRGAKSIPSPNCRSHYHQRKRTQYVVPVLIRVR